MDAGNLLKPALASGQLRCIGSTTFNDVKQSFDRDRALSRRFQKIDVLEPSEDEALEILKGLRLHYESHHGVQYDDEALAAAVSLSARHLQDLHLPDKAIDVIDEAGAAQKMLPAAARIGRIGAAQIEQIVAKMARVPVQTVSSDDKRALERLDVQLKQVIFGQDGPIDEVASAIKLSRSGLRAPDKPIGNFLFAGPTGVGKTELARQLARIMGIEFIRFDMSEYMEKHAVSRLDRRASRIRGLRGGRAAHRRDSQDAARRPAARRDREGPSGHVQHPAPGDGPRDADGFARPEGRLPSRRPDHDDQCRRSRSVGSQARVRRAGHRAGRRAAHSSGRSRLNSATASTPPSRLARSGTAEIEKVVDKQIDEVRGMVVAKKVTIAIDPAARTWLATKGFDRAFGARPMARLIERVIKKPLSEMLLFGALAEQGGNVRVTVENDAIRLVTGE